MTYQALFRQLHRAPAPLVVLAAQLNPPRMPDKALASEALSALMDALKLHRTGRALTAARVLLLALGPDKALERMRRAGVLRTSTYGFRAPAVHDLIADWIAQANLYGVSPRELQYLTSARTLSALAPSLLALYNDIVRRLRAQRWEVIKTLLAEIDYVFAFPDAVEMELGEETDAQQHGREELAEAFSYLLSVFQREIKLEVRQFAVLSPSPEDRQKVRLLLTDALALCRFRESEALLEGFPYRAERVDNQVRVLADDPELEQALTIGFLQYRIQNDAEHVKLRHALEQNAHAALDQLARQYAQQIGQRACRLELHPFPRYVVEVPLTGPVAKLLGDDTLFIEEVSSLNSTAWEEFVTPASILHAVVAESITVLDLLKVQRLFRFMHQVLRWTLSRHSSVEQRDALYLASCLPVLSQSRLDQALLVVLKPEKVPAIRLLLQAELASPSLDIQYAPLIAADDYWMVSPAVLASSNLVRNVLARRRLRLVPPKAGIPDPMHSCLADALRDAGFLVAENVSLASRKNPLEVDILAYRDDRLFVFECKYTYHPCNVYEMRNTYDAMIDAAQQLDLRHAWLEDATNKRQLSARLGWEISEGSTVHTCIALGNRVFTGYTCHGHPVRQVYEMLNVLQHGYLELDVDVRRRLWRNESFAVEDLLDYLAGTTTLADMVSALIPVDVVTPIGKLSLVRTTVALDATAMQETMLSRYPLIIGRDDADGQRVNKSP